MWSSQGHRRCGSGLDPAEGKHRLVYSSVHHRNAAKAGRCCFGHLFVHHYSEPCRPYYEHGLAPTKIYVEDEYIRSAMGGTGFVKIGGNYAAAMIAEKKAHDMGFDQVLWLDAKEKKYVEEIGTSNAFFKIDGEIYTSSLIGTILPGITRASMIEVMKDWGYKVNETRFTIDDVFKAGEEGKLEEVFATGTAAVISPVGELYWKDKKLVINNGEIGELSQKLYDELYGIQTGAIEDKYGWTVPV